MCDRLATRFYANPDTDGGEFNPERAARIITNLADKFPPDAIVTMGRDPIRGRYIEVRRRERPLLRVVRGGESA